MKYKEIRGTVLSVRLPLKKNSHITTEVPEILLEIGIGIQADAHSGLRLSDVRETALLQFGLPKGFPIANHRQFSATSKEEFEQIKANMGITYKTPYGLLGENLVIEGIPNLTQLPSGTLLFFQKSEKEKRFAVLAVWGENNPCTIVGEAFAKHFEDKRYISLFPKKAKGLRGIVGSVYSSGKIKAGDTVIAMVPNN
jgi:hypothetical protein